MGVARTERNTIEDVSAGLSTVRVPITVLIGDRDQVEYEPALRKTFARILTQAIFRVLNGIGHLSRWKRPTRWPRPTLLEGL